MPWRTSCAASGLRLKSWRSNVFPLLATAMIIHLWRLRSQWLLPPERSPSSHSRKMKRSPTISAICKARLPAGHSRGRFSRHSFHRRVQRLAASGYWARRKDSQARHLLVINRSSGRSLPKVTGQSKASMAQGSHQCRQCSGVLELGPWGKRSPVNPGCSHHARTRLPTCGPHRMILAIHGPHMNHLSVQPCAKNRRG